MNLKHFQNKARQSFWLVHMEAWRRSGLARTAYCRHQRFNRRTFDRWMNFLLGKETASKHTKYLGELRREQRREKREKGLKRRNQNRYGVSTDVRDRALQAFWAMHVEAMNWSGMGVREYAAAMYLSATSLRIWRDRFADGEVEIDWRAHLHPSARPVASTSAKESPPEMSLTNPSKDDPGAAKRSNRRIFTDEQKHAIALETEQPGVTVSAIARKHGIVTGLLFRWRVQFGLTQKKRATLAPVVLADGTPATLFLRDLVRPPDGMTTVDLVDGRRVFAPVGSDPDIVRAHIENAEIAP